MTNTVSPKTDENQIMVKFSTENKNEFENQMLKQESLTARGNDTPILRLVK